MHSVEDGLDRTFQDVAVTSLSSSCCFLAATCATLRVMLPSPPPPPPPFVGEPPAGVADPAAEGPSASSACSCHHAASSSSLRSLRHASPHVQQSLEHHHAQGNAPRAQACDRSDGNGAEPAPSDCVRL